MKRADPTPTRLLKARIHAIAENAAARLKFKPGDPMEPLVVRLGGRIEYKTAEMTSTKLPESIVVRAMNDFTIFLPSVTSVVRDRFTIAHELGHLFLHYPLVAAAGPGVVMTATRWVNESDEALQRAEWEANWFAAAFLMPSAEFIRVYESMNRSSDSAAIHFGVSPKAAEIRAHSLRI